MEELNKLLARMDEQQEKLLFFFPVQPAVRQKLKEMTEERNRQLRKFFAQQLWSGGSAGALLPSSSTSSSSSSSSSSGMIDSHDQGEEVARKAEEEPMEVESVPPPKRDQADDNSRSVESMDTIVTHVVVPSNECQVVADLPVELWAHVVSFLTQEEMFKGVAFVNRALHLVARSSIRSAKLHRFRFRSILERLEAKLDFLRKHCAASLTSLDLTFWRDTGTGHDEHAVAAVQAVLHRTITDLPLTFTALRALSLYRCGPTAACLAHFARFRRLRTLNLHHCTKLDDGALALLPPTITTLDLSALPITDEGMKLLPPAVTDLDLSECKRITPRGFVELGRRLPRLASLDLTYVFMADQGHMAALPSSLTSLRLMYPSFGPHSDPAAFQHLPRGLARLWLREPVPGSIHHFPPALTCLSLISCRRLTAADYRQLSGLAGLTKLTLDGCRCLADAEALSFLVRLTRLEQLSLSRFQQVTGIFLDWLPPSLRQLQLRTLPSLREQPSAELRQRCVVTIINSSASSQRGNPIVLRRSRGRRVREDEEEGRG